MVKDTPPPGSTANHVHVSTETVSTATTIGPEEPGRLQMNTEAEPKVDATVASGASSLSLFSFDGDHRSSHELSSRRGSNGEKSVKERNESNRKEKSRDSPSFSGRFYSFLRSVGLKAASSLRFRRHPKATRREEKKFWSHNPDGWRSCAPVFTFFPWQLVACSLSLSISRVSSLAQR